MPLYDFTCADCGPFAAFRTIEDRDQPCACPDCGGSASRQISVPNFLLMPVAARKAHAVNERSRHEPRVRRAHQCASGCGCGKPSAARKGQKDPLKAGRRNSRPWMLGH